jgi:hypothetical protein
MPSAASGPPKPGEPDFMSVFETNEPMIAGQPGRIAWTSAMPASDSAVCCASAAGTETGPIAPIMMNGVMFTIWLRSASIHSDSSMRVSNISGEFALIVPNTAGSCSSTSGPPSTISAIAIESSTPLRWICAAPTARSVFSYIAS